MVVENGNRTRSTQIICLILLVLLHVIILGEIVAFIGWNNYWKAEYEVASLLKIVTYVFYSITVSIILFVFEDKVWHQKKFFVYKEKEYYYDELIGLILTMATALSFAYILIRYKYYGYLGTVRNEPVVPDRSLISKWTLVTSIVSTIVTIIVYRRTKTKIAWLCRRVSWYLLAFYGTIVIGAILVGVSRIMEFY